VTSIEEVGVGPTNTLPEQEAPRKSGRQPPIVTNLIRLQSDLKEHVKGEYEFRNTRNGTLIITTEMADNSATKSFLEKKKLHYFTFSPKFRKAYQGSDPIFSQTRQRNMLPAAFEDLGFNVINERQLTTNPRAPNRQTYVETLPLFMVTLTGNVKSQEIFKLNSLNHIIIKVISYRAPIDLTQCYNCQNFGHV
jgi:hypothetical protein